MRTLVHLRGTNASGKSTAVRQFCRKYDMKLDSISVSGKKTWIMHNDKYAAIGKYKPYGISEGCDAWIDDKEHLKATIDTLLRANIYSIVVFEGVIYGNTYKLAMEIDHIAKRFGYMYKPVYLDLDYTERLRRLLERNGGNTRIRFENIDQKYLCSKVAFQKLLDDGLSGMRVDVTDFPIDSMWKIVAEASV